MVQWPIMENHTIFIYTMQHNRSPTACSQNSKVSHNFQLLKTKLYLTNPNPQQRSNYARSQQFRYDYNHQIKQKSNSFRVRKSLPNNESKSQNGRTIYQIRNFKQHNQSYRSPKPNTHTATNQAARSSGQHEHQDRTLTSKSEIMFINNKNFVLRTDKQLSQPKVLVTHQSVQTNSNYDTSLNKPQFKLSAHNLSKYQPQALNIRKNRPLFFQKEWSIREQPNSQLEGQSEILKQQIIGSIFKQSHQNRSSSSINTNTSMQVNKNKTAKQTPLNPSEPQDLTSLLQKHGINLQKIEQQQESATIQIQPSNQTPRIGNKTRRTTFRDMHMNRNKDGIICQKQLIEKLNARTKYYRYKHNQRIQQKYNGIGHDLADQILFSNGHKFVIYDHNTKQISDRNKSNYFDHRYKSQQKHSPSPSNHQKLYLPKYPSPHKVDHIQFNHTSSTQDIIKALHHQNDNKVSISIKVPVFFHSMPDLLLSNQQLKFKATLLFEDLAIMNQNLVLSHDQVQVLRHPQSLIFIFNQFHQLPRVGSTIAQNSKNSQKQGRRYCINWYKDGSVYMGQLEADYRHGVGLQWVPGVYVYFGQYQQNYRHGYGVMKYNNKQVYIGLWGYDCYHGYGKLIDQDGWVIGQGIWRNKEIVKNGQYNQLS